VKKRSAKESARALYAIASRQQGYFTASQARASGYRDSVHAYHVRNGDWERAWRGIYRLAFYPSPARPELVVWSLWTRDRRGRIQGVFSHHTARELQGDGSGDGERLHLTVPPSFRKGSATPAHLVLHKAPLQEGEIERREGYALTTRERTSRDLAGAAPPPAPPRRRSSVPGKPPRKTPRPAPQPQPRPDDWAVWS